MRIVQAGSELFRLIRQGRLEWRAEVKGETLLKLAIGQEVIVNSPLGSEVKGRVRRLSPTIDMTTGNGLVYVDLPTGTNLKAGLTVSGSIGMGKRKALFLPSGAVVRGENDAKVFRIGPENKLVAVDVRTEAQQGRRDRDRQRARRAQRSGRRRRQSSGSWSSSSMLRRTSRKRSRRVAVPRST